MANNMIASHPCFLNTANVNIDFSTQQIFADAIPEKTPPKNNLQSLLCSKNSVPRTSSNSVTEKPTNVAEGWTDNMSKLLIATYSEHKKEDKIVWKFYEDFQNIYFRDPYFEPVAVASSSGGIKRKMGEEENAEARNLSPGESKRPKKLISALEMENRKQKRKHEEPNTCWPLHDIVVFMNATYDGYQIARAKAKKAAEYNRDLASDTDKSFRKLKKKKYISSSSDE
ncbi:hypothetical protein JTB14_008712 [Gonioctena quinquepunctata]|nr:hypothetical protein JTB14_008712 [Gonioctena quinquepunctata]